MKKAKAKTAKRPRARAMPKPKAADSVMTGAELKAALDDIGITQMGFARLIGVGGRTVRGWIAQYPVPKVVALLVRLIQTSKTKPDDLTAA